MKRKGFTLIELLAVIVVLAIIALIATPIVMNVIKNAQMGAAERSADNYVKAVDLLISTNKLDGNSIADGRYTIGTDGNLEFGDVEVSGTRPNGGTIVVENGQVVKNESSIKVGDYIVNFEDGVAKAEEAKELVGLSDVCEFLEEDAHNQSRNSNTVGAKYSCDLGAGTRNFYVLEAGTTSTPATLILEGNYDTTMQAWCDPDGDNPDDALLCQGDGLMPKLDEIADAWEKLDRSQIGIPSASQIAIADGQSFNNSSVSLNNGWLYNWPGETAWANDVWGYWTSTPSSATDVYAIHAESNLLGYDYAEIDYKHGIRPVIMLSI